MISVIIILVSEILFAAACGFCLYRDSRVIEAVIGPARPSEYKAPSGVDVTYNERFARIPATPETSNPEENPEDPSLFGAFAQPPVPRYHFYVLFGLSRRFRAISTIFLSLSVVASCTILTTLTSDLNLEDGLSLDTLCLLLAVPLLCFAVLVLTARVAALLRWNYVLRTKSSIELRDIVKAYWPEDFCDYDFGFLSGTSDSFDEDFRSLTTVADCYRCLSSAYSARNRARNQAAVLRDEAEEEVAIWANEVLTATGPRADALRSLENEHITAILECWCEASDASIELDQLDNIIAVAEAILKTFESRFCPKDDPRHTSRLI